MNTKIQKKIYKSFHELKFSRNICEKISHGLVPWCKDVCDEDYHKECQGYYRIALLLKDIDHAKDLLSIDKGKCYQKKFWEIFYQGENIDEQLEKLVSLSNYFNRQLNIENAKDDQENEQREINRKMGISLFKRSQAKNQLLEIIDKDQLRKVDHCFLSICEFKIIWKKVFKKESVVLSDKFISLNAHITNNMSIEFFKDMFFHYVEKRKEAENLFDEAFIDNYQDKDFKKYKYEFTNFKAFKKV